MEFVADDLRDHIDRYIGMRPMSKQTRILRDWRITDYSSCMEWPRFLMKDPDYPAREPRILCRQIARP
jgi:hypothetical protein